ncbi:MAG: endo-1,4-beta-xylanase [Oscillospiraceae bacterium]|nr:endo-1,4-beta-xylanase [Oscillospiraceae bacterium]
MKRIFKAGAALMSLVLAAQGIPLAAAPTSAADSDAILVTDFEDGDVSAFSKRGDTDTSVIAASTEDAHSGTTCMAVTERSNGWNGPSVSLSALGCEPGVQYLVTAWVKMQWYNNAHISMQYSDADGTAHYANLSAAVSQGEWVQIPEVKFSFSEDMQDVSIYIEGEGSDKPNMWVDDFSLTKAPVHPIQTDIASLKDVYADYFKIGGAVTAGELAPQSTKDLILKHYNSLTLGNELKPENMLDQKACQAYLEETGDNTVPQVRLNGQARIILNFCREHNMPVRGHVLVWHSQTPGWFFKEDYTSDGDWVDKETMLKRMENYIKGVFAALEEEYSDINFYAWDVVNEAWRDDGTPRLGGTYEQSGEYSGWVQVFGDNSFIPYAFEYARKYAPAGTKLYYNDFNEYMPQKVNAIISMATELKEKGLIDGIGLQSHLNVTNNHGTDPFPSASTYKSALAKYAALGLDLQVTELDATYDHDVANGEELQAQYYSDIMDAIVEYKDSISAVVFWGTTDDQSWRASRTPLLFNEDYTAKPCYYSIIDGIEYTVPDTTASSSTTTTTSTSTTTETTVSGTDPGNLKLGDVDCNGEVDVLDAVMLARITAEDTNTGVTDEGKANADMNQDKAVKADDLTALLRILAGLD